MAAFNREQRGERGRGPERGDGSQGRGSLQRPLDKLSSGRNGARAKRPRAAGRGDLFASVGSQVAETLMGFPAADVSLSFFLLFFHISDALERKTARAPFGRGVQCPDLPRAEGIWEAGGNHEALGKG